jgi:hypothetical protein
MFAVVYYADSLNSEMVASAKMGLWLQKQLEDLGWETLGIDKHSIAHHFDKQPSDADSSWFKSGDYVLFVINIPKTFVVDVPRTERLVEQARVVVWCQNDYSIWSPNPDITAQSIVNRSYTRRYADGKPTLGWTTCARRVEEYPAHYSYINWNAIAFNPLPPDKLPPKELRERERVLYYGAYRDGREKDFDKYMKHGAHLIDIAAPPKGQPKFIERYGFSHERMYGVIDVPGDLPQWAAVLHLEDDASHRAYHSPPNRFYEALSADCAIIVDQAAAGTLRRAGFDVPLWALSQNHTTLTRAMRYIDQILENQRKHWQVDPKTKLPHDAAVRERLEQLVRVLP